MFACIQGDPYQTHALQIGVVASSGLTATYLYLLVLCKDYGNMIYSRDCIRIIFPYSILRICKYRV